MNTAQARNIPAAVNALTARRTPREVFEMWVARNRPGMSLERKKVDGYAYYVSTALQAEWLAFAAGLAFRGMLP